MPDWREFVRLRLGRLDLDRASVEEIETELAGHLEDSCEAYLEQGLAPVEAEARALEEVPNWRVLSRRITEARRTEETMIDRMKHMWIPGLCSLVASTALLLVTARFRAVQQIPWADPQMPILLYVRWLLALPLIGGLGAYWSRRAGGSRSARVTAALFPLTALIGALFVLVPVSILIEQPFPLAAWWRGAPAHLVGWVVIPAAALLAGAWPFLGNPSPQGMIRESHLS